MAEADSLANEYLQVSADEYARKHINIQTHKSQ